MTLKGRFNTVKLQKEKNVPDISHGASEFVTVHFPVLPYLYQKQNFFLT